MTEIKKIFFYLRNKVSKCTFSCKPLILLHLGCTLFSTLFIFSTNYNVPSISGSRAREEFLKIKICGRNLYA